MSKQKTTGNQSSEFNSDTADLTYNVCFVIQLSFDYTQRTEIHILCEL